MSLVTYLLLLSGDFSIVSVPNLGQQYAWMYRIAIFEAFLISRGAKTYRWKPSISTYFVQISSGYPSIYSSSLTAQGKQNVPGLYTGVSIELRAITLTKAARTMPSFTWRRPKVDFREVQVPVYINGRKSDLNRPWLERAACWKRQEVRIVPGNVDSSQFLFAFSSVLPLGYCPT